jgi:hypothetical protein
MAIKTTSSVLSSRFSHLYPWDTADTKTYPADALNTLTKKISQWSGLVWQYQNSGCHARACFIADFLHKNGVPIKNISYILVGSVSSILNSRIICFGHSHHIAVTVNQLVVDCLIDPDRALPECEWLSKMGINPEEDFDDLPDLNEFLKPYKSKYAPFGTSEFTLVRVPVSHSCGFILKPICNSEGEVKLDPDGFPTYGDMELVSSPWTVEKELKYLDELRGYQSKVGVSLSLDEEPDSRSAQSLYQLPPGAPKIDS